MFYFQKKNWSSFNVDHFHIYRGEDDEDWENEGDEDWESEGEEFRQEREINGEEPQEEDEESGGNE